MADKLQIQPASGKLGILTPGMGAVSTTFIAGVIAIRQGLRLPIGSFTQMSHIRLGKRTDDRQPLVKNFVPLADLNDIAFGGWDIFEDSVYDAAVNAGPIVAAIFSPGLLSVLVFFVWWIVLMFKYRARLNASQQTASSRVPA